MVVIANSKVYRQGNSLVVVIPHQITKKHNIKNGDILDLGMEGGGKITLEKRKGEKTKPPASTP